MSKSDLHCKGKENDNVDALAYLHCQLLRFCWLLGHCETLKCAQCSDPLSWSDDFFGLLSLSAYSETLSLSSLFTLAFLLRIRSLNICTTSLNIAKGTTDPHVNALKSNKIDEYWISTLQKIQLENESLYREHCSCLYFVLLSELEHSGFLSQ